MLHICGLVPNLALLNKIFTCIAGYSESVKSYHQTDCYKSEYHALRLENAFLSLLNLTSMATVSYLFRKQGSLRMLSEIIKMPFSNQRWSFYTIPPHPQIKVTIKHQIFEKKIFLNYNLYEKLIFENILSFKQDSGKLARICI